MSKEDAAKKKFGLGKLTILIIIAATVWACFMCADIQSNLNLQATRQAALAQKEQELEREKDYRTSSLGYIDTDEYIEKQARERLGWVKENETVLVIVSEDGTPITNMGSAQPENE